MDRRDFLSGAARLALVAALPRVAAAGSVDRRFVLVILRGALDGLAAVAPYGEPRYAALRGPLALAPPGAEEGVLELDGLFGLHPALPKLHALYASGQLAVVHAAATPYRSRSHFDGQKVLETGGSGALDLAEGWIARAVAAAHAGLGAVSVTPDRPLVVRGAAAVPTYFPSSLPSARLATLERVQALYASDPVLGPRLAEGLRTRRIALGPQGAAAPAMAGEGRGRASLATATAAAARLLAAPDGPRLAVLEAGGWDTHANQGAARGRLAARLGELDAAVHALQAGLGSAWAATVVAVVSEFGRTVAANGTAGTDHGTGSCVLLAGGAVAGGRVVADWPGLAAPALFEGRDLAPTTDHRAILKGVLAEHLHLDRAALDRSVFPGTGSLRALEGLIRAG